MLKELCARTIKMKINEILMHHKNKTPECHYAVFGVHKIFNAVVPNCTHNNFPVTSI